MANIIIFGWFKIFTVIKHPDLLLEPLELSFCAESMYVYMHTCQYLQHA